MAHKDPIIDPEFAALLDEPTPAEKKKLEEQIKAHGQTEDLIGWEEAGVLVDGHTRFPLLKKHGHTPRIDWRSFGDPADPKSRDKVIEFIADHQLGRRNLRPNRYEFFLARKYEAELKKNRGKAENVAKKVAAETGKSEATVRRAARKQRAARGEAPKPKPKKAGRPKFNFKAFDAAFGVVARGPDDLCDAYPEAPAAAKALARQLNQTMNQARRQWEGLVKYTVKA